MMKPKERVLRALCRQETDRPPLEIEGHPARELWKLFRRCFPDFEVMELGEIIPRSISPVLEAMGKHVFPVDDERILRPEVTSQLVDEWLRSSRKPCKRITAGRVFRVAPNETETCLEVHHQAELFWVEEGLGEEQLLAAVHHVASKLMPKAEYAALDCEHHFPLGPSKEFRFPWRGTTTEVAAGGVGDPELMRRAGLNPNRFGSIHFAFGLERCAMVRYDLDDARKLWQPPYVPERKQ